jgi:hypothetical protein
LVRATAASVLDYGGAICRGFGLHIEALTAGHIHDVEILARNKRKSKLLAG